MQTLNEYINVKSTFGDSFMVKAKKMIFSKEYAMAAKMLLSVLSGKSKSNELKHDIYYYAAQIARSVRNVEAKELVKFYSDSNLNTFGLKL